LFALKTREGSYFRRDHVGAMVLRKGSGSFPSFSTSVESFVDKTLSAQRNGVHGQAVSPPNKRGRIHLP